MQNALLNQNWVKTRPVPQLAGIRTHASHFTARRNAPRHVHQEYVFGLMTEGALEIDCGHCGATHVLKPGDLLLTEAHEVYASRALDSPRWRYFSVGVTKEKLISLLDFAGDANRSRIPHFTGGAIRNEKLRRQFLNLYAALDDERTALERETLLLAWIASVYEDHADDSNRREQRRIYSESAAIRRVREYIRENVAENIRLETLSRLARLSPFHLNRTFSAQVGLPPHEFQNQLRIESAVRRLAQKQPLADIAAASGFSDQSHFNRFFKRYTGVTPKNFLTK